MPSVPAKVTRNVPGSSASRSAPFAPRSTKKRSSVPFGSRTVGVPPFRIRSMCSQNGCVTAVTTSADR